MLLSASIPELGREMKNPHNRFNLAGLVAVLLAICVGGFLYAALAITPPRLPDRQQTEDVETGHTFLRPDCQAAEIAKVPVATRSARINECAAAQEQFRLDRDGLTQAVRTTDATEEGTVR